MAGRKPTQAEAELLGVYQDAEQAILAQITRHTGDTLAAADAGRDIDAARAAGMTGIRGAVAQVVLGLDRRARPLIDAVMLAAAEQGAGAAAAQLAGITGRGRDQYGDPVPRGALDRLAAAVLDRVTPAHAAMLRVAVDGYRQIVARVVPGVLVGADTRRDATQRALWALADRGISGFTDTTGRRWSASSYAEMAVRTAAARAHEDAKHDRLAEAGFDLVIVQGSGDRCEKCRPWSGAILSLTGSGRRTVHVEHATRDGEFLDIEVAGSVDDARRAGVFHPQCRCSTAAYQPGITRVPPPVADDGQYEARQRQRTLERQIRGWKAREAAALDPAALKYAKAGTRGAQARMREHLDGNPDLLRRRYREQPGTGNLPTGRTRPVGADPKGAVRAPRDMSDAELDREMQAALGVEDMDAFERFAVETDKRDERKATRRDRDQAARAARDEERAAEIERLIDAGHSDEEAVARVTGVSVDKQRRAQAMAQLKAEGLRGKSFDALSRDSWKNRVWATYEAAEQATNGYMVNAAGRAKGVGDAQLFIADEAFVRKYATPELQEWFDQGNRVTLDEHRAELLGDHQGAYRARMQQGDTYQ